MNKSLDTKKSPGKFFRSYRGRSTPQCILILCAISFLALGVYLSSWSITFFIVDSDKPHAHAVERAPAPPSPGMISPGVTTHTANNNNNKKKDIQLVEKDNENRIKDTVGITSAMHAMIKKPWGYNSDRNIPRIKAIFGGIIEDRKSAFSLVDYGSDQGYFSILIAKMFPLANIMSVEMGGIGGQIWAKKSSTPDVLTVQENKLNELGVKNVQICQTKVHQSQFFKLQSRGMVSDYQLVLSVFHWFSMKNRKEFDLTVSTLFLNALTTFIELPTIGDNSNPLIKKQVGYPLFSKWYDGRTDIGDIMREAAGVHGVEVNVTRIAGVPWLLWTRELYRVDLIGETLKTAKSHGFNCEERVKIYACNRKRENFNTCLSRN
eukprot:Tbor_TRINITY_DN5605_c1_g1::TRINITY_DN5605_c1_g1_i1::g.9111::m.9111